MTSNQTFSQQWILSGVVWYGWWTAYFTIRVRFLLALLGNCFSLKTEETLTLSWTFAEQKFWQTYYKFHGPVGSNKEYYTECVSFIWCPRGFRPMESLANLSNMHSQKFSAFRWVSVEKRDHKSFQARLQDCPSVFEDEIFHILSNRKARKRDSLLACDSAFVRGVGAKNSTKKFLPFFNTHWVSYLNGV